MTDSCSAGRVSDSRCGWQIGKRDTTPCMTLRRRFYFRANQNKYNIQNVDLPKVQDWAKRLNECGNKVQSKNYCAGNSNSTWVWELILVKQVTDFDDWAFAKPPFKYSIAFGYDGIGFIEEGDKGIWHRCTRHLTFTPVQNSDFQFIDPYRENQWSRSEITLGPQGVIRSVINGSSEFYSVLDEHNRGIICFYDKLWLAHFTKYSKDQGSDSVDVGFECVFQPVRMQRYDYIEHLINRQKCGATCYKQNMYELPCIEDKCILKDAIEYEDTDQIKVGDKDGNTRIVTGKDAKRADPPKSCIDVCVVGGSICKCDCDKLISDLAICQSENRKLKANNEQLTKDLSNCKTLNEQLTKDLANCKIQNNNLRETNKNLTEALIKCNANYRACQEDIKKLISQITEIRQELATCQKNLDKCAEELTGYQNELKNCNDRIKSLTNRNKILVDENEKLKTENNELKSTNKSLTDKISELEKTIKNKDILIDVLNIQLDTKKRELQAYRDLKMSNILIEFFKVQMDRINLKLGENFIPDQQYWTDCWSVFEPKLKVDTYDETVAANKALNEFVECAPPFYPWYPKITTMFGIILKYISLLHDALDVTVHGSGLFEQSKVDNLHKDYYEKMSVHVWNLSFNNIVTLFDIIKVDPKPKPPPPFQTTKSEEEGQQEEGHCEQRDQEEKLEEEDQFKRPPTPDTPILDEPQPTPGEPLENDLPSSQMDLDSEP